MMRFAVIDANYSRSQFAGMAATWLRWELQKAGVVECMPDVAEVLLVTVSSQQGVSDVRRALKRAANPRALVVLGGGGAYAPAVFDGIADVICVGEGARFIRTLLAGGLDAVTTLPECWIPKDTRRVTPNNAFPWDVPPLNHPDGTVRLFGSRGCRYKCLFCQTGWERAYTSHPHPAVMQGQAVRLETAGRRVAIVTNDGGDVDVHLAASQEFLSIRLDNMARMMPITRKHTKSVRIGVEGLSERMRAAVGKPVPNDGLLDVTARLLGAGVGVRWFFIVGLPGETDDDYAEMRALVRRLSELPKGCVILNFHAFVPMPATPLGVLPLQPGYWERFDEFRRWFFHGPGFTRHAQIIPPAKEPGRMSRARESMAATDVELRRGWWVHDNPNWRVRYLHEPERLRHMAQAYATRVGMRIDGTTAT